MKEDQYIKTTSSHDRNATAGNIQSIVNASQEKLISRSTVKRRLVEHGLNGRVTASKPLLRAQNKQKRLLWARNYNIEVTLKKIGKKFFLQMNLADE